MAYKQMICALRLYDSPESIPTLFSCRVILTESPPNKGRSDNQSTRASTLGDCMEPRRVILPRRKSAVGAAGTASAVSGPEAAKRLEAGFVCRQTWAKAKILTPLLAAAWLPVSDIWIPPNLPNGSPYQQLGKPLAPLLPHRHPPSRLRGSYPSVALTTPYAPLKGWAYHVGN